MSNKKITINPDFFNMIKGSGNNKTKKAKKNKHKRKCPKNSKKITLRYFCLTQTFPLKLGYFTGLIIM